MDPVRFGSEVQCCRAGTCRSPAQLGEARHREECPEQAVQTEEEGIGNRLSVLCSVEIVEIDWNGRSPFYSLASLQLLLSDRGVTPEKFWRSMIITWVPPKEEIGIGSKEH